MAVAGAGFTIRKNVTNRETHSEQTDNSITEATLIPWIAGLSGPISSYLLRKGPD